MRKLVIAIVLLVLIAVVGDRVAAYVVEQQLASHIDSTDGVEGSDVNITGFPFLTQVVDNHFDEVEVTLPQLDRETRAGSVTPAGRAGSGCRSPRSRTCTAPARPAASAPRAAPSGWGH